MKRLTATVLLCLPAMLLVGCTAPAPAPTVSPPAPPSSASPSATPPSAPPIATVDDALAALTMGPDDDRAPYLTYAATLVPGQPETFSDARADAVTGPVRLRVTCASVSAATVRVEFTHGTTDSVIVDAPCGSSGLVTSQGEPFTLIGPFDLSMVASAAATAGIGIVRE